MKKMPMEDVEKCRKYTKVFREMIDAEGYTCAYLEGYAFLICGVVVNDEPDSTECYYDAASYLKELKRRWIFYSVWHLYDLGLVDHHTTDNDPIENWLNILPEPYKTKLTDQLNMLLKQCE